MVEPLHPLQTLANARPEVSTSEGRHWVPSYLVPEDPLAPTGGAFVATVPLEERDSIVLVSPTIAVPLVSLRRPLPGDAGDDPVDRLLAYVPPVASSPSRMQGIVVVITCSTCSQTSSSSWTAPRSTSSSPARTRFTISRASSSS